MDLQAELAELASGNEALSRLLIGEQAASLLRAALDKGFLEAARQPSTPAELAASTGCEPSVSARVCAALHALNIFEHLGIHYCLTPGMRALLAPGAPQILANTLHLSRTQAQLLEHCLAPAVALPTAEQRLAIACGVWGHAASPIALASFAAVDAQMPEVRQIWEKGARHLELGCGAGRDLLRVAVPYPKTSVVGVDREPVILEEVDRQAREIGIADRVTTRQCDARAITDTAYFDTILWSHMFFPPETRPGTIEVIQRALKAGGFLLLPMMKEPPETEQARRTAAGVQLSLNLVLRQSWGLDWVGVDDVRAELEPHGFTFIRTVPHHRTAFVLMRGPDDRGAAERVRP